MPLQSLTQTNKREVESYNCSFELLNLRWIILFLLVNKQNFQVATAEILKNTGVSLRAGLSALSFNTKLRQAQPRFNGMPLQCLTQTNKREVESYNCSIELLNLRWTILFFGQ